MGLQPCEYMSVFADFGGVGKIRAIAFQCYEYHRKRTHNVGGLRNVIVYFFYFATFILHCECPYVTIFQSYQFWQFLHLFDLVSIRNAHIFRNRYPFSLILAALESPHSQLSNGAKFIENEYILM